MIFLTMSDLKPLKRGNHLHLSTKLIVKKLSLVYWECVS